MRTTTCLNRLSAIGVTVILIGCDASSPTAVDNPVLPQAEVEALAASVLDATARDARPLPSLQNLLRRSFQAIKAAGGHEEGQKLFRRARWNAQKAAEARRAGNADLAKRHSRQSHALTLEGIIAVLGDQIPGEALEGVNQALDRLAERLEGKTLPDGARKRLSRARELAAASHAALTEAKGRAALGAALAAADLIRSLSPRYRARKAIERSTRAFKAAYEAVKADPSEAERRQLKRARRFLGAARAAFEDKGYGKALKLAIESAKLSLEILRARAAG